MSTDNDKTKNTAVLTTEGKLRHEVQFLKDRVNNLEVFKKNFFAQHYDLIDARDRIAQLEEQLSLNSIKQQLTSNESQPKHQLADSSDELLDYFHSALTAASLQDLVMSLFQSADGLAKDVVVQIRDNGNLLDFCLDESIKKENLKIIKEHHNQGGVINIGDKTLLNHKHLSLIYTPTGDNPDVSEKQLKKFMDIIALGANTRTSTLKQRTELNTLKQNIYKIFKKMNHSFDQLQGDLESNIIDISTIYTHFASTLMNNLIKMKLDQTHISLIEMMVNDTKSELLLALTKSMTLDKDFIKVLKRLENAYAKAHKDT